jgi:hypothetical protein
MPPKHRYCIAFKVLSRMVMEYVHKVDHLKASVGLETAVSQYCSGESFQGIELRGRRPLTTTRPETPEQICGLSNEIIIATCGENMPQLRGFTMHVKAILMPGQIGGCADRFISATHALKNSFSSS